MDPFLEQSSQREEETRVVEVNSFMSQRGLPVLPSFSGINPREWVRHIEEYFLIHRSVEVYKDSIVEDLLVDKAKVWYSSWCLSNVEVDCNDFVDALCIHFEEENTYMSPCVHISGSVHSVVVVGIVESCDVVKFYGADIESNNASEYECEVENSANMVKHDDASNGNIFSAADFLDECAYLVTARELINEDVRPLSLLKEFFWQIWPRWRSKKILSCLSILSGLSRFNTMHGEVESTTNVSVSNRANTAVVLLVQDLDWHHQLDAFDHVIERLRKFGEDVVREAVEQENTCINLDAYDDILVITSGEALIPNNIATFLKDIQRLAYDFLLGCIFLSVGRVGSSTDLIVQRVENVHDADKRSHLLDLLHLQRYAINNSKQALTLVFVEIKKGLEFLEHWICALSLDIKQIEDSIVKFEIGGENNYCLIPRVLIIQIFKMHISYWILRPMVSVNLDLSKCKVWSLVQRLNFDCDLGNCTVIIKDEELILLVGELNLMVKSVEERENKQFQQRLQEFLHLREELFKDFNSYLAARKPLDHAYAIEMELETVNGEVAFLHQILSAAIL